MIVTLPPELLVTIREYLRLRQIPADKFPGYKAACMSNLVGAIGEKIVLLYEESMIKEPPVIDADLTTG